MIDKNDLRYAAGSVCLAGAFALAALPASSAETVNSAPSFRLHDPGTAAVVRYEQYGQIANAGTPDYHYYIRDRDGLARAVGEGIYPNVTGLLKDPAYQKEQFAGSLEGNPWNVLHSTNVQRGFFQMASTTEIAPGVRQFFVAQLLEEAGLLTQAVKAYQAVAVHYPKANGNTAWKTPWYVGPAALDSIAFLTRRHPELGMRLDGGRIRIANRYDDDPKNDVFSIDPGKIVPAPTRPAPPALASLRQRPLTRRLGHGRVHLEARGHAEWQLIVDSEPYVVRGMSYFPTPVGRSPDSGTLVVHRDWMLADDNKNGKIDGPYDSWVDKNHNDVQDANEPAVGDFRLLKEMGVNTLRLYHHGFSQALLTDLYETYGIRVIMGDYLGAYAIGSGASWEAGTDYNDPEQRKQMLASVRDMVRTYRDEPYVLMWMLGNENNYGNQNNSRDNPDAYYAFVNEAARLVKQLDPTRPVALANGDLLFMDKAARKCPDVDVFGVNVYRGNHGMGDSFWQELKESWGKPVLISEFGCPAYHRTRPQGEAEALQAEYLRNNWRDIEYNLGGGPGAGNAIGGVLFEFLDEWWKAGAPPQYDPAIQETTGQFGGPFPDGWSYEEWYGIAGQGNGKNSPYERQLRKAYFVFRDELWNARELRARGLPQ